MIAARVAFARIAELIDARLSFSLETTLSGRAHLAVIAAAKARGFRVNLLFFSVAAVEICLSRVARRVSEGGHPVSEVDVRRRFERASRNFPTYAQLCDLWRVYDNNGPLPRTVAEGRGGCVVLRNGTDGVQPLLAQLLADMPDWAEV